MTEVLTADTSPREFAISLAAWSLHRTLGEGRITQLDMPKLTREEFDIGALELVSPMLASTDAAYLDQLAGNAAANQVKLLLIMVDNEGAIASPDAAEREDAVARHGRWIDIAAELGCHSIRLNWHGADASDVKHPAKCKAIIDRTAPPLRKLCGHGDARNVNVLIENHGGPSSYPEAVIQLVAAVDHERFGTLPDFGNFPEDVDRYLAIDLMMNYAKAVSAKCGDFDDATGEEMSMDYARILDTVAIKHAYHGHVGIEYGGNRLSEFDGIKACKRLLDRLGA
jgi:L-ribulose-5-phosphate 3-epimerase